MNKLNTLFIFLLFLGCTYKIPKVTSSTEFNLVESNPAGLPRTTINHPDINYVHPSTVFLSIIFLVFLISFLPVLYKTYTYINKKILTFFKK